jgi:hypothetical protein
MAMENFMSDIGSQIGQGAGTVMSTLGVAAPYIGIVLILGGVFWYLWYQKSFNKDILFFKLAGPGFKKLGDRGKVWKDKHGVAFWRSKTTKLLLSVPPSECVLPGDKGDFVSGYINTVGEVIWNRPGYHPDIISKKIVALSEFNARKTKTLKDGKEFNESMPTDLVLDDFELKVSEFLKDFRPVTTNQRASYAYQEDMAKRELKLDFLKQNFPIILGGIFIIVFIVVLGMMWGKFLDPINSRANANEAYKMEMEKVQNANLVLLHDIYGKVQHLESSLNLSNRNDTGFSPPSITSVTN